MSITDGGQTVSVYLLPGMKIKIKVQNFFVNPRVVEHKFQDGRIEAVTLIQGFVVDNPVVGTIEPVTEEPAVFYTHNMFEYNMITFYSRTGEKGQVAIMSVPIHDHSSIVAGGPAYSTYFSDDQTITNET